MAFMALARDSGGKILSIHCMPLLPRPVTVPWSEPVKPLTASAMVAEGGSYRRVEVDGGGRQLKGIRVRG